MSRLSIIIVNWHSRDYVRSCCAGLYTFAKPERYEIVVIDNASFDGVRDVLAAEFPRIQFMQSPDNLGFAAANNLAAARTTGDILLFLNPDTFVIAPALSDMVSAMDADPRIGVLGPRLLNSDNSLQTSAVLPFPTILNQVLDFEPLKMRTRNARLWGMRALFAREPHPVDVEAVSGACLMIRRDVFEQVMYFSEKYFMYSEDIDLCTKVRRAGYRVAYLDKAVVVHHGGKSAASAGSAVTNLAMRESTALLIRTFRGKTYESLYRISMALAAAIRLAVITVLFAVLIMTGHGRAGANAFIKWRQILGWSITRKRRVPVRKAIHV